MIKLAAPALLALLSFGCYSPNLSDGKLKCSVVGNKCPEGYHCAIDGTCWKNGHDPMGTGSGPLAPHKGTAVVSGGVTAQSEHYKVIMSTGQPPGGNANAAGTANKTHSGLAGATQAR
jgi:hypothetical protein